MRVDAGLLRTLATGTALAWAVPVRAEPPPTPSVAPPAATTATATTATGDGDATPSSPVGGAAALESPNLDRAGPDASSVRLGGIGFPYGAVAAPPGLPTRGWTVTPSLGVQLLGTDNLQLTRTAPRADFITSVVPGLLVNVDTARLRGILNYAPTVQFYAAGNDQNRIDQRFNGQFLATIVPETVFLDVRGTGNVQAAQGGFAPEGNAVVNRNNQVQTTSFQLSPYVAHRFGGLGTVQVGYAFQSVTQSLGGNGIGGGSGTGATAFTAAGQPFFSGQDFTAHEFYATARSGEDFGRLALVGRLDSTSYDGTGVLEGAYRRIALLESRYAFSRMILGLVEVGYEQQRFAGLPPFELSEPVWAAGGRLTLAPDSWISAKYGRRDGFNSATVDSVLSLGGRTQLFANYAERLTTSAQRAADLLSTTTVDERGNPVDTATGAPVAQPFTNSFLGVQSSLARVRRGAVSLIQSWPRDRITLTLSQEERQPVSVEVGNTALAQRGTSGSLSWLHQLTPVTSVIGNVQYGRFTAAVGGRGDVFSTSASLVTQLTPRLSGFAQYALTSRGDDGAAGRALQNVVLVGVRQTF